MNPLESETRPWGTFHVLVNDETHKVKKLIVNPKQRLSLQYHKHRVEVWVVVKGQVRVTCDEESAVLSYGESIRIPLGSLHRIENITDSPAELIEVQTGTYFGEDDIIRVADDFNRENR